MKADRDDCRYCAEAEKDLDVLPGEIFPMCPDSEYSHYNHKREELAANSASTKPSMPFRSRNRKPAGRANRRRWRHVVRHDCKRPSCTRCSTKISTFWSSVSGA